MSDKICGFIVVMEKDLGDEYSESLKNVFLHIKGVSEIRPIVSDLNTDIGQARGRMEMKEKILELLREDFKKNSFYSRSQK